MLVVYSLKIVIVWITVLTILVYTQIFTFSVRLLFVTKKNSRKKCDIVVYENASVEDIAHARTATLLYTSFTVTMSQSNMTALLLNHNHDAKMLLNVIGFQFVKNQSNFRKLEFEGN